MSELRDAAVNVFKTSDNLDMAVNAFYALLELPENAELARQMYTDIKQRHLRVYLTSIGQQLRQEILAAQSGGDTESADTIRTSTIATPKTPRGGFIQPDQSKAGAVLQQVIEDNLLNFTLPIRGQKIMRNATCGDLTIASEKCRKLASANSTNSVWFTAIAARIGDKSVGEVLSHDDLKTLRMNAEIKAFAA